VKYHVMVVTRKVKAFDIRKHESFLAQFHCGFDKSV
jgi:hypothetical protein